LAALRFLAADWEDVGTRDGDVGGGGRQQMVDDKNRPITLADLDRFATKDDLKNFATKDDLKNLPTRADFAVLQSDVATLRTDVTGLKAGYAGIRVDLASVKDELRDFRSEFSDFKGWTQNTLDRVVKDIGDLKQEMTVMRDSRMRRIYDRLARVEKKVGLPPEEYY
jgi:uncharacterized membrane protein